jgi:trehalose-6-phosphate synthase
MPAEEQEQRMVRLRQEVATNNVYRWAGMLLSEASKLMQARPAIESRSQVEIPA